MGHDGCVRRSNKRKNTRRNVSLLTFCIMIRKSLFSQNLQARLFCRRFVHFFWCMLASVAGKQVAVVATHAKILGEIRVWVFQACTRSLEEETSKLRKSSKHLILPNEIHRVYIITSMVLPSRAQAKRKHAQKTSENQAPSKFCKIVRFGK